jgi:hypothetical protein
MQKLPTPPVPELARAEASSVKEAVRWFENYYNRGGAPFNYRCGTKSVRTAYKGFHNLRVLRDGANAERTEIGKRANDEVIQFAAPVAFGRKTQVFDLAPRRFSFGKDRQSAYRIPFFFVESGVVHAYFLQPRKSAGLNLVQMGFVASLTLHHLLEQEFYGEKINVEFVDVGTKLGGSERVLQTFNLEQLPLWSESALQERLTIINEALDIASSSGRIVRRPRSRSSVDAEMPLFD